MIIQYRFECYEEGKYGLAIKTDNLALFIKLQNEINKTINIQKNSNVMTSTNDTEQKKTNIKTEKKE